MAAIAAQEIAAGARAQEAAAQSSPASRSCLALQGGGLRSVAVFTALTSGLMHAAHTSNSPPTLHGSGLYAKLASLASVSGGSWFAAELIYSERFLNLVEGIAADHKQAAAMFGERWTGPWLSVARKDDFFVKVLAKISGELGQVGAAEDLLMAGYFWKTGLTWTNFTLELLETTAGIDMSYTLGHPVMDWAKHKTWLCCHTLVAPSSKQSLSRVHIFDHLEPEASVKSTLEGDSGLGEFVPATYSIVLGSASARAPVPYVAETAVPKSARWSYAGPQASCWASCCAAGYSAKSAEVGAFANLCEGAGSLPVVSCAAASSAAAGSWILSNEPLLDSLLDDTIGSIAVWQGTGVGHSAFQRPESQVMGLKPSSVNQASVDELAHAGLCAVIDGGNCDDTAIAYAIAAGFTEVVAYISNTNTDKNFTKLLELFAGPYTIDGMQHEGIASPIFQEQAEVVWSSGCAKFTQLEKASGARFLQAIVVGTLSAITAENKLWGIHEGVAVIVHVIAVTAAVAPGGENVHDFDVLVQEVVDTLALNSNSGTVQNTILPWFLGSKSA
mmetsp:Transcript_129472/g.413894  ORF Transcript_129472/g.413894 Transcript_129472/m.413894 type:complete len:558 (+) Transcript_129472:42-1715(+)